MYEHIKIIENSLKQIASFGPWYIDKVNDFPSLAIIRKQKHFEYINNGIRMYRLTFTIRGYVMSDEDSIEDSEILVRNVETRLNAVKDQFEDIRILSIDTDTGLLSPYGMCDIECEARWYEC